MRSTRLPIAVLTFVGLVLTGCSSSSSPSSSSPSAAPPSSPGSDASSFPSAAARSAAPAPADPRVGSCHDLTLAEATEPVDTGPAVPCRGPHTSVTVRVGHFAPVVDGHLLAVDSRTVRAQITKACPPQPTAYLGGTLTERRLSRFQVVWFSPSLDQADAGATWYRCDVVAPSAAGRLLLLPARVQGVLGQRGALDRFGTCGTAAPDTARFARVGCSQKHSWRAVDVVALAAGARYLGRDAGTGADSACKDIAAARAEGALKYSWSFEWPTRVQWQAGQRYGYCWVPES